MRILICSDGSEQAQRAMDLGVKISVGCRAEVTLLGILEKPGLGETIPVSLERGREPLVAAGLSPELLVKSGDPLTEIIRQTEKVAYDLAVIGAVRKQVRGRFWMSSKTYRIIREIKPPVLSVAGECSSIKRILICSGGKQYIDPAVRLTGEIARGLGASVTLLHVMPEPPAIYAHLPGMEETAASLLNSHSELGLNLRREMETLQSLGVPTEVRIRRGSVLTEILREAHGGNYDLVATGSALNLSLRTYMLGDISREIVNHARCAVLVGRRQDVAGGSRSGLLNWWRAKSG